MCGLAAWLLKHDAVSQEILDAAARTDDPRATATALLSEVMKICLSISVCGWKLAADNEAIERILDVEIGNAR